MTVAVPSTPASYFHLLRRHSLDGIRRPLVVFTPKSMLRNKAAVSDVEDFTTGKFRSVFEEPTYETGDAERDKVRRVLLVSGKLYWELLAKKQKDNREDIAIVRIEQLYPVPSRRLRETLDRYPNAPSSGGFRRSRRTRVRGRSSVSLCPSCCPTSCPESSASRVVRCRHRPRVRARCTLWNSRRSSMNLRLKSV